MEKPKDEILKERERLEKIHPDLKESFERFQKEYRQFQESVKPNQKATSKDEFFYLQEEASI
ncbi:MAG: hypothetical protein HY547_03345 [Elusimicrobia bacterium]|nr:hypothetical protein [Elusimicrobiota bacterium]